MANTNEFVPTQNGNEETVSNNQIKGALPEEAKVTPKLTMMDKIAQILVETLSDGASNGSMGQVKNDVFGVIRTLMEVNACGEYAKYLRASGQSYRFDEYQVVNMFEGFIGPASVKVIDDELANDLLDRKAYDMTLGRVLSPDEMFMAEVRICKRLKLKVEAKPIDRSMILLTSAMSDGVMVNEKVHSSTQEKIVPLKLNGLFDAQYFSVSVTKAWAIRFAGKLLAASIRN
jgi:hypothetical protein